MAAVNGLTNLFLIDAGNDGLIVNAKGTGTGNTNTSTTVNSLSFNPQTSNGGGAAIVGSLVEIGSGGHPPDILASVATSSSITIVTATSSTVSGTAVTILNNPILIGGESSALTNGSAVTSSYWNGTGIVRLSDIAQAPQDDVWFFSGGAFTPTAGGALLGWFLPEIGDGSNYESVIATASSTQNAMARSPDFVIPVYQGGTAYAASKISYANGRFIAPPPVTSFKIVLQNLSGATMPSTWAVGLGPFAIQY